MHTSLCGQPRPPTSVHHPTNPHPHHTHAIQGFPERIPQAYAASVPWCCYWCCHALDVLGAAAKAIGPALRRKIQATLKRWVGGLGVVVYRITAVFSHDRPGYAATNRCQQPDGGFAGLLDASASTSTDPSSPYSPSHVLSTYAALATLAILHHHTNTTQPPSPSPLSLPFPSRQRLRGFLLSLKHPTDGTFRATPAQDAEVDARSIYGALAVARLGGWLDDPAVVEKEKLIQYLVGLQTHEGGFAGESGDDEAHAAFSFCALASLALLGAVDRVRDPGGLARWAARRQRAFEGGCDGRTNKLVDACYAFWAGALPPLLSLSSSGQQDKTPPPPQPRLLLHGGALARYLLAVAQDVDVEQGGGGFADKPGAAVDYYHTCYALSGLSVAVHDLGFDLGLDGGGGSAAAAALLVDGLRGRVRRVDVRLNVCVEALRAWDAACPLPD